MAYTVLSISGPKPKVFNTPRGPVTETYRYITVEDPEKKRTLIRIVDKRFSKLLPEAKLRSGDIINIDGLKTMGTLPDGIFFARNPTGIVVVGHIKEKCTKRYLLSQIKFYDWGVILRDEHSKAVVPASNWNNITKLETGYILNRFKDRLSDNEKVTSYVQLTGGFNVHFGWRGEYQKWLYADRNSDLTIEAFNLLPLTRVVAESQEIARMKLFTKMVRATLESRFVVNDEDIEKARKESGIDLSFLAAKEMVLDLLWKEGYDESYFTHLKRAAESIYYSEDGFVFVLRNGKIVLEEPEYGKATYVFQGPLNEVVSRLEAIRQSEHVSKPGSWKEKLLTWKKRYPDDFSFFIDRVIHGDYASWLKELEERIREVR